MNKTAIIVTLLVAAGLIYWVASSNSNPTPTQTVEPGANDHVLGNLESGNVIIEYADYQCPACASYNPILKAFMEKNKDKVALIYRHFPLRSIHPNAQLAGQAAEAAHIQGKFWEMTDKIYTTQTEWAPMRNPQEVFVRLAGELGLDVKKFEDDLKSDQAKDIVNKGYDSATALKLNATPSFFFNGQKINGPRSVEGFEELIK